MQTLLDLFEDGETFDSYQECYNRLIEIFRTKKCFRKFAVVLHDIETRAIEFLKTVESCETLNPFIPSTIQPTYTSSLMKYYCTELKNVNGIEVPVQEKLNELYSSDSSRPDIQDQIIKRKIGSQRYQRRILETTASNRAEKSIKTTTKFKLSFHPKASGSSGIQKRKQESEKTGAVSKKK